MDLSDILSGFSDTDMMIPIAFSIFSGAVIGGERALQGKDAGLRTHMLVCFTSCLLTLLGLKMSEWNVFLPEGTQIVSDMSRMPHAIITGVGFLGAGVIFKNGSTVHGLTTAASLWLTAALGVTFGTYMIQLGVVGLICTISILILMRVFHRRLPNASQFAITVTTAMGGPDQLNELQNLLGEHGLTPISLAIALDVAQDRQELRFTARMTAADLNSEALAHAISRRANVSAVSIRPLEIDS